MLVAGLAVCWSAHPSDNALENAQLALLVRQLNQLERTALDAQKLSDTNAHRYHFDYARLTADLARIRGGIEDYLSPPRAQPRDPDELSGQYRASGEPK
ncbi:MAG: RAQPRD family integrative conjugative element protein [Proteobacteria bacterium]|nr:RAQPRD family integrative conjugative element protein [Pseudomonadota bacterium]